MTLLSIPIDLKKLVSTFSLLLLMLVGFAQIPVAPGGAGQTSSDPNDAANGGDAIGLGCGGGGANWYGGNGGAGKYGGGGGGAAGFGAANMVGGVGGSGVLVVAFYGDEVLLYTKVCTNGSSIVAGPGVLMAKVWAIGAGGGGAGSTDNDGVSGGGGGAGGVAYISKPVSPGDVITYSLGAGGAGGIDANDGNAGGNTTATIAGTTITGNGGQGGFFNSSINALGGSFSDGDGGSDGGEGQGISGDRGGGGGGGIGVSVGGIPSTDGGNGADAIDVDGLFSALGSANLLPLKWKSFTALNQKDKVLLQWETISETNTLHYTIQYSTNGSLFENIGKVAAAGNSSIGKTYHFIHQNPLPVTGYYRLQQMDIDGRQMYSAVIKNNFKSDNDADFILPATMIANGTLQINAMKPIAIDLVNIEGKVLNKWNLNLGVHYLNISSLTKGLYFLRSGGLTKKIIVQ